MRSRLARWRRLARRILRPYAVGYERGRVEGHERALRDAEAITQAAVRMAAVSGASTRECTDSIITVLRSYR